MKLTLTLTAAAVVLMTAVTGMHYQKIERQHILSTTTIDMGRAVASAEQASGSRVESAKLSVEHGQPVYKMKLVNHHKYRINAVTGAPVAG